jgi:hypothetical protein
MSSQTLTRPWRFHYLRDISRRAIARNFCHDDMGVWNIPMVSFKQSSESVDKSVGEAKPDQKNLSNTALYFKLYGN